MKGVINTIEIYYADSVFTVERPFGMVSVALPSLATLPLGILWPPGASHRPSTAAQILTPVLCKWILGKFSSLTTHLLTAKSKSTCLDVPFPVNETIHHRSSFAHTSSF